MAGDPVEAKKKRSDGGTQGQVEFSKERSRSELKHQLAATAIFKFLLGASKSTKEGIFSNSDARV